MRAVRAVFDSWDTPRAQVYRRANDIPDDLGTAVNVVQMVFGNKGDRRAPASRSRATRRPARAGSTASSSRTRRARTSSQGSARRSRSSRWRECMPGAYEQLLETMRRLEEHYRDMQDVEFTVEEDGCTCCRPGRRSAPPPRR